MRRRILVVEDEPTLAMAVSDRLESEGYTVDQVSTGEMALERAAWDTFDLVMLDIMLPGRDGFDVCRELRQQRLDLPILMLTARSLTIDKVVGLKLGADDYVTKPFDFAELLARVEALLRRVKVEPPPPKGCFRFGSIQVNLRQAEVIRDNQLVVLPARQFKLLQYFIEHRGATLSREELLCRVWEYDSESSTRTVDIHVAWLRQKLEDNPKVPPVDPNRPRPGLQIHRLSSAS
jgi:two-component system, OmpR family, alkaline phosphatase synthesis response regulator PhoP